MTVSSVVVTAGPTSTNGVTTVFGFTFRVDAYNDVTQKSQVVVTRVLTSTGAETVLTVDSDYTISFNSDQDTSPGGSVTISPAPASGYKLYLRAAPSLLQSTELQDQGAYNASAVEAEMDNLAKGILDLNDRLNGAPYLGVQKGASFSGKIAGALTPGYGPVIAGDRLSWVLAASLTGAAVSSAMIPVVTASSLDAAMEVLDDGAFLASGGASAARSLSTRFGLEFWVEDFGAVGDGATNDATAINAALTAAYAASAYGGVVRCANKLYAVASTIVLGNGSASAYSTKNGVSLRGSGAPFLRLDSAGSPLNTNGTRFIWTGASGGTMVEIDGPCQGNAIQHIALNCNDLADYGLVLKSASRGHFPFITISDFNNTGLKTTVVSAETISGMTEGIGTEGNIFDNLRIDANDSATGVIGIDLEGYTGSASNGFDTTRCWFRDTYLLVNRVGGTGIKLGYVDQCTFTNTVMSGFGTADGNQSSIKFVGTSTTPSANVYPQNIVFDGQTDIGQTLPVKVTGTPGYGNHIKNCTLFDQQSLPTDDVLKYVRFDGVDTNGDISSAGQGVLPSAFKNKLLNARMDRATRGATFNAAASGAYNVDQFVIVYDGAVTVNVTQQSFTIGQTSVDHAPRKFLKVDITAASGATFFYVGQRVEDVETLSGRKACQSAWMMADATRTIAGRLSQNFGSGGSPSSAVDTVGDATVSVTTAWRRQPITFAAIPSVSGKTRGTAGDHVGVYWSLPINTVMTFYLALPQLEEGRLMTRFENRSRAIEEPFLARYLQGLGAGSAGGWASANTASVGFTFPVTMRATPAVTATGASAVINTPGDNTFTDSGVSTVGGATLTLNGGYASITKGGSWSATPTALRPAILTNDILYASAEL